MAVILVIQNILRLVTRRLHRLFLLLVLVHVYCQESVLLLNVKRRIDKCHYLVFVPQILLLNILIALLWGHYLGQGCCCGVLLVVFSVPRDRVCTFFGLSLP